MASTIIVPDGWFLVTPVVFRGPCKNRITLLIHGTILAPSRVHHGLGNSGHWILFSDVNGVEIHGGTLDARGAAFWDCRRSGDDCPVGKRLISFYWANHILINGLTLRNSQVAHLVVNNCNDVRIQNVKVFSPAKSPNTDGIHVQTSDAVSITQTTFETGDDCVSIGPGTTNLHMSRLHCGPGHGISIGSLCRQKEEGGVENITLTDAEFVESDNGVRIKTWARPCNGFVRNIIFQNIIMRNVQNPIIIDQNYCPHHKGCHPHQSSGVKISEVTYRNIRGTSATKDAMTFNCSFTKPCKAITLQDIELKDMEDQSHTTSICTNIDGTSNGVLTPLSCF